MFLRPWPDSKRIPIWCNNCKKENPCGEVAPFKKASCIYFFFCHLPPSGLKSFGNFTAVVLRSPPPTEESTEARPRRQECAPAHAKTRNRARYFAKALHWRRMDKEQLPTDFTRPKRGSGYVWNCARRNIDHTYRTTKSSVNLNLKY